MKKLLLAILLLSASPLLAGGEEPYTPTKIEVLCLWMQADLAAGARAIVPMVRQKDGDTVKLTLLFPGKKPEPPIIEAYESSAKLIFQRLIKSHHWEDWAKLEIARQEPEAK